MTQRVGRIHGTGLALNIELGWIPDHVKIVNLTDGDQVYECWLGKIIVFTSGSVVVKPGDTITGVTSGATAKINEIILDSGTWSGGDAAGWLMAESRDVVGTLQTENADVGGTGDNDLSIVVDVELGVSIDDSGAIALANVTGNSGILEYVGDASNGYNEGFTIGSVLSEDGKLFGFIATRSDVGEGQGPLVLGNNQRTLW